MILYVQQNEETSCLKMVHFHKGTVPSEMEANAKSACVLLPRVYEARRHVHCIVLDEAFPEITVDLVQSPFLSGKQMTHDVITAVRRRGL